MHVEIPTIYHYTSKETFPLILESKQLWLTEATALNDETEIIHFTQTFDRMLSQGQFEFYEMESTVRSMLNKIKPELFGIACFSNERDSLTNWRFYGGDTTGIAIAFDAETLSCIHKRPTGRECFNRILERRQVNKLQKGGVPSDIVLRDIPNLMLKSVQYEDFPEQALIDKCLSILPPRHKIDTRVMSIGLLLISAACTLKKKSYDAEKETRLIKSFRDYYQQDHELYDPGFLDDNYGNRIVHGNRRLYYKHDFLVEQVREVMLGKNCTLKESSVREMLIEWGYPHDLPITRSAHRYRTTNQA